MPGENANKKQEDTQLYLDQEIFKKVMMWEEKSAPQEKKEKLGKDVQNVQ